MSPKDHTIAATDRLAETLSALARINPDNPTQSANNLFAVAGLLRVSLTHVLTAARMYDKQ